MLIIDHVLVNSVNLLIFGTAESAITVVAASIPVLRILIRDTHSPPTGFMHESRWMACVSSEVTTDASQLPSNSSTGERSQPSQRRSIVSGSHSRKLSNQLDTKLDYVDHGRPDSAWSLESPLEKIPETEDLHVENFIQHIRSIGKIWSLESDGRTGK